MADYVHKNILSEAYVHIEMVHLSAEEQKQFSQVLLDFTTSRGKFAIYDEITPEVRTKDGSLKVYSSITGTLCEALGTYQTFEEALHNLYVDSRRLAEAMILETLFLAKARGKSVLRREARTGIVRSTKDIFDHMDQMKLGYADDSSRSAVKKLRTLRLRLDALFKVLVSQDDVDLIKTQAREKLRTIRVPLKLAEQRASEELSQYQSERRRLTQYLADN